MSTWYLVCSAKEWTKAIIFQGQRLLDAQAQAHSYAEATDFSRFDIMRFNELQSIRRMEEYFFVIAVNKARDWLKAAGAKRPVIQSAFDRHFEKTISDVSDLRDMREHELQYLGYIKGKCKKPEEFVRNTGGMAADATSTFIDPGRYMIGNRLCVEDAINVAETILPVLEKELDMVGREEPDDGGT